MNTTLVMFLYKHLFGKNFGMAGAVSVLLFIVTAVLSFIVFRSITGKEKGEIK
jgi:multiple sugar transport system permease protein